MRSKCVGEEKREGEGENEKEKKFYFRK